MCLVCSNLLRNLIIYHRGDHTLHEHHIIIGLITMIINKLVVRQINIHGVGRSNISSLTELLYFSAPGKALRRGRGAVQDDERVVHQCTS